MKRAYAGVRVLKYLADTTGECISRVRVACGITREQMETVVFDLQQYGLIVVRVSGNRKIIQLCKEAQNQ